MKVLNGKNELLKKILEPMTSKQIAWTKLTDKYMELIGITNTELIKMTKGKLKERTNGWGVKLWIEEVSSKTSLNLFMERKKEIREEKIYNNTPSSIILYKARMNCLPLNDRKGFTGENTTCILCDEIIETLEHFILECPAYNDVRKRSMALQRPYIENTQKIVGDFLFTEDTMNGNKEILCTI